MKRLFIVFDRGNDNDDDDDDSSLLRHLGLGLRIEASRVWG